MRDLNCTEFQATLGLSAYTIGIAVVPMMIAAFSEEFGRWPLFFWSTTAFELTFIMIAMCVYFISDFISVWLAERSWTGFLVIVFRAPNIQTVIAGRFLQGCFAATGAVMVSGTIADIWSVAEYVHRLVFLIYDNEHPSIVVAFRWQYSQLYLFPCWVSAQSWQDGWKWTQSLNGNGLNGYKWRMPRCAMQSPYATADWLWSFDTGGVGHSSS